MKIAGLALAVVSLLAGILWWTTQREQPDHRSGVQPTPTRTPAIARARPATTASGTQPTPTRPPSPATETPTRPASPSPNLDSQDVPPTAADPSVDAAAVTRATRAFVDGWVTRTPKKRVRLLTHVTTDELLDGLANTLPDNIPSNATTDGPPSIIRAAGGTVEARQTFTNHPPIAVLLTIDVSSRHGWVVASVRPTA